MAATGWIVAAGLALLYLLECESRRQAERELDRADSDLKVARELTQQARVAAFKELERRRAVEARMAEKGVAVEAGVAEAAKYFPGLCRSVPVVVTEDSEI